MVTGIGAEDDRQRVESLIERYGNQWIATARRVSASSADAEDAYQRALEILLTKPPVESDPERLAAWMHTVIRNEALQVMRGRRREIDAEFDVIVGGLASDIAIPDDAIADSEDHAIAREALRRLRPDQTRCLLLRADGFDYPEICRITGFSYAKVNRLLSEGRKAARMRADGIASGRECERLQPLISMFVDGVADEASEQDLRIHIEHCAHCRVALRDYALAPKDLAAVLPVGVAIAQSEWWRRLLDPLRQATEFVQVRLGGGDIDGGAAVAKKALAVIAVGATAAGGGLAVKHSADATVDRPVRGDSGVAKLRQGGDASAGPARAPRMEREKREGRAERTLGESVQRATRNPENAGDEPLSARPGEADAGAPPQAESPSDGQAPPSQDGALAP